MTFVLWVWRLGASAFKGDGNIGQMDNTQIQAWIEIAIRSRLWIIIIILKLVQGQEGMNFSISAMHKLTCQHQLKRRKMTNFLSLRKNLFYIGGSGHAWSHANLTVLKVTHMSLCFGYHRAVIHCVQRKKVNTRGYFWPAVKSHHINVGSEDGFKGFSDKQE